MHRHPLTDEERAVYEWQMWTPDFGEAGQERLKAASVLVSRCGGLGGVVAYSNTLKQALLGVRASTLTAHGAVSEATAKEMAVGALEILGGDVAVAVTGIAGPDGGLPGKPVGTVWFGWAWHDADKIETRVACEEFKGDREEVRRQTIMRSLSELDDLIYP